MLKNRAAQVLIGFEDGQPVTSDGPEGIGWIGCGPDEEAFAVYLDDERLVGKAMIRVIHSGSGGRISVIHCTSREQQRKVLRQLWLAGRPVLLVGSDHYHPEGDGFEALAYTSRAPVDFTFGGIRADAVPRLLVSGSMDGHEARATREGIRFLCIPWPLNQIWQVLLEGTTELIGKVTADLANNPGDFLRGQATWGPRDQVEGSLRSIQRCQQALDSFLRSRTAAASKAGEA